MSADLAALFDPVKVVGERSPLSEAGFPQFLTLQCYVWTRLSLVTLRGVYTVARGFSSNKSKITIACELSRLEFNLYCLDWLFGWPSDTMSDAADGRYAAVLRLEGGEEAEQLVLRNALRPIDTCADVPPILCADPIFEPFPLRQSPSHRVIRFRSPILTSFSSERQGRDLSHIDIGLRLDGGESVQQVRSHDHRPGWVSSAHVSPSPWSQVHPSSTIKTDGRRGVKARWSSEMEQAPQDG